MNNNYILSSQDPFIADPMKQLLRIEKFEDQHGLYYNICTRFVNIQDAALIVTRLRIARRPALQEEQNSERQRENEPDNISGFREHRRFVDGREKRTGRKDEVERTHGVPGQTVCYAQDEARILSFQHQGDHGKGADGRYRHMVDYIQPQSDPALKKLRKHSGQGHEPSGIQEMDAFEQEPAEQQFARTVDDLCLCIHSSRQVFW